MTARWSVRGASGLKETRKPSWWKGATTGWMAMGKTNWQTVSADRRERSVASASFGARRGGSVKTTDMPVRSRTAQAP